MVSQCALTLDFMLPLDKPFFSRSFLKIETGQIRMYGYDIKIFRGGSAEI